MCGTQPRVLVIGFGGIFGLNMGMWQLATIYGTKRGEYSTLRETLREFGYSDDDFDDSCKDLTEYEG